MSCGFDSRSRAISRVEGCENMDYGLPGTHHNPMIKPWEFWHKVELDHFVSKIFTFTFTFDKSEFTLAFIQSDLQSTFVLRK